MKIYKFITILFFAACFTNLQAQDINWLDVAEGKKNHLGLSIGADYSSYYGASYGYTLTKGSIPLVAGLETELSFGSDVFDDWYTKLGLQTRVGANDFFLSAEIAAIARGYDSDAAQLFSWGSLFGVVVGIQKQKWGIAAQGTIDRAIVTKITHDVLRDFYPKIQDGWYLDNGGNYQFGVRGHLGLGQSNLYLHVGRTYGIDFESNPTLPFYLKLSFTKAF